MNIHLPLVLIAFALVGTVASWWSYRAGQRSMRPHIAAIARRARKAQTRAVGLAVELQDERILNTRLDAGRPLGLGPDLYLEVAANTPVAAEPDGGTPDDDADVYFPHSWKTEQWNRHDLAARIAADTADDVQATQPMPGARSVLDARLAARDLSDFQIGAHR